MLTDRLTKLALAAADHYLTARSIHDEALAKQVLRLARITVRASKRSKRRGLAYAQEQSAQWQRIRQSEEEQSNEEGVSDEALQLWTI
ncbi:MAG: hypothetical protein V4671_09655 [Armatimonadota bacterium]